MRDSGAATVFGEGMIFAAGQIFKSPAAGNGSIIFTATGNIEFLGVHGWDDGIRSYTGALAWDAGDNELTPASDNGNSGFAFFRLAAGGSPVTSLMIEVPHGYNTGTGDVIEFAFGIPIPEPASATVLAAAAARSPR